ncbi:hypothetical protein ZHAS_00006135 [Anopheles sinensis]|uniref:Uncharacterized protein n=1 Tax=Anopheles sinensis TaxID=74873 RepID=A0A084VL92_ANOSI|nr:hypothetical protein ZHAS_00006135 [Anopheles sinensis]
MSTNRLVITLEVESVWSGRESRSGSTENVAGGGRGSDRRDHRQTLQLQARDDYPIAAYLPESAGVEFSSRFPFNRVT